MRLSKTAQQLNNAPLLFFTGQNMCTSHHHAHKWRIRLQGFLLICVRFEIYWHQWVAFTEQSEGCFCSYSPHFLQIRWCVLAVTWALRASSVIKRHQAMNNEKERERDPRRFRFCSPLRRPFHSNWTASGPKSWMPSSPLLSPNLCF